MSTQIKTYQPAAPGEVFAPDAFESEIGRRIPMTVEGRASNMVALVIGADVAEDGSGVLFKMEIDGVDFL